MELEFAGEEGLPFPSVGIVVHSAEGALCYGTNSVRQGFMTEERVSSGVVRFALPRLPLHEGRFAVTVALHSHDESEVYDWLERWLEFSVFSSNASVGLVDLAAELEFQPASAPASAS